MSEQYTHDVFISFSFSDQDVAEEIVNELTSKYGFSCWICTRDVDGGKKYKKLIPQAIRSSKVVVFLQSKNAVESKEIPKEIGIAFDSDKIIIPFKLDESQLQGELEYDLYGIEYIDATIPTKAQRIHDLAVYIGKAIGKPLETGKSADCKEHLVSTPVVIPKSVFCGREALLREIDSVYRSGERILFLYGIGGIGKTQIAKQYAKQYRKNYDTILYATYNGSLINLFTADEPFEIEPPLMRKIFSDGSQEDNMSFFKRKMKKINELSDSRTLVIIDNFDEVNDENLAYLMEGRYHLLITSRCDYSTLYHTINVKELESIDDIIEVFMQNYQGYDVEKDDPDLITLIELVNRHTYTVELLAQHMENSGQTVKEMICALKENGIMSLNEKVYSQDMKTHIAYENILKIFKISALSEEERQVLINLSFMPIEGVLARDFRNWTGQSSNHIIRNLEKRSWIIRNSGGIALHPIVRDVVRHECNVSFETCKLMLNNLIMCFYETWGARPEERAYYGGIAKSLYDYNQSIQIENAEIYFAILYMFVHLAMYDLSEELVDKLDTIFEFQKSDVAAKYYLRKGDYLLSRLNFEKAIESLLESCKICEELSQTSYELAYASKYLANAYHAYYEHQNHSPLLLDNATKCLKKSRKIFENCIEEIHPQMGSQWYAEGVNYYHRGQYAEALECENKSLDIFMKLNGEIHSDTTAPIRVLAKIYSKLGRLDDAVKMQEKSIEIQGILWRKDQFEYFEQLETLADIYFENGLAYKGVECLEKVIELIGDKSYQFEFYVDKLKNRINDVRTNA